MTLQQPTEGKGPVFEKCPSFKDCRLEIAARRNWKVFNCGQCERYPESKMLKSNPVKMPKEHSRRREPKKANEKPKDRFNRYFWEFLRDSEEYRHDWTIYGEEKMLPPEKAGRYGFWVMINPSLEWNDASSRLRVQWNRAPVSHFIWEGPEPASIEEVAAIANKNFEHLIRPLRMIANGSGQVRIDIDLTRINSLSEVEKAIHAMLDKQYAALGKKAYNDKDFDWILTVGRKKRETDASDEALAAELLPSEYHTDPEAARRKINYTLGEYRKLTAGGWKMITGL